jgi:hypothetical protein
MPVSDHGRLIEHSERSRSSAKKDMKPIVSAGPQWPEARSTPSCQVFANNDERFALLKDLT